MPALPSDTHHAHRKLGYFLALSAGIHVLLAVPAARQPAVVQLPAMELVLTTAAASSPARPRSARTLDDTPAPAGIRQKTDRPLPPPEDHGDSAPANHLHSLLRAALDRHFVYPPFARRNGWQGRVELLVRLDGAGRVDAVHILRSSGHAILDQDALLTVQRIGWVPEARAWLQGYSHDVQLPVLYRLTEG